MKNKNAHSLVLVLLALIVNGMHAQTHRFYYTLKFKLDSTLESKDIMVLDIEKDKTIFLSKDFLDADSISLATQEKEFAYPKFADIVIRDKKTDDITFIKRLDNEYRYTTKKPMKWKISSEKKQIGIYNVQKASSTIAGRNWVAWFSTDIPLPYGSYFFANLPGLILEIYDDKKDYHFQFAKNININTKTRTKDIIDEISKGLVNIKEKDWEKIQINMYKDPIKDYKNGDAYMEKDNGERYTAQDYKELEENIQRKMRKYNNPLELDKRVDFDKVK